nr:hypothetical protein [Oscillospiraceae bacterium]
MSKLMIECFDIGSEVLSFSEEKSRFLTLCFTKEQEGYVCIGNISTKIEGNKCLIDISRLPDGEYTPKLVQKNLSRPLPSIKKENGIVRTVDYGVEYLRELSIRERRLCERVDRLSERLEEISKKVYGSSIF